MVDKSIVFVIGDGDGRSDFVEERDDGFVGVIINNGYGKFLRVGFVDDFSNEGFGVDDVEGGDIKEVLGVEDIFGFEDFGGDGDGRVDGVGDDKDESFGGDFGGNFDEVFDDISVDVEEIVMGYVGFV